MKNGFAFSFFFCWFEATSQFEDQIEFVSVDLGKKKLCINYSACVVELCMLDVVRRVAEN